MINIIFPQIVLTEKLNLNTDKLTEYVLNYLGSGSTGPHFNLHDTELQPLLYEIKTHALQILKHLNFKDNPKICIEDGWCTRNNYYAINEPHVHADSTLAAVFYLRAPKDIETGYLGLQNPAAGMPLIIGRTKPPPVKQINVFTGAIHRIKPEVNKLVIFPSWLYHYAETYEEVSKGERISLAFDINIRY
jgi:uncharacterized protein (TIGR02466 family)